MPSLDISYRYIQAYHYYMRLTFITVFSLSKLGEAVAPLRPCLEPSVLPRFLFIYTSLYYYSTVLT